MALKSIDATLQVVAAGQSAATEITTAPTAGIADLTLDVSRTPIEVSSRGYNQKRALLGQQSVIISGSAEADAAGLTVMRTALNAGSDVYAKFKFADGSSVTGQMVVTKANVDDPVDGQETWSFELQPSATATATNGNVVTFAAAPAGGST